MKYIDANWDCPSERKRFLYALNPMRFCKWVFDENVKKAVIKKYEENIAKLPLRRTLPDLESHMQEDCQSLKKHICKLCPRGIRLKIADRGRLRDCVFNKIQASMHPAWHLYQGPAPEPDAYGHIPKMGYCPYRDPEVIYKAPICQLNGVPVYEIPQN